MWLSTCRRLGCVSQLAECLGSVRWLSTQEAISGQHDPPLTGSPSPPPSESEATPPSTSSPGSPPTSQAAGPKLLCKAERKRLKQRRRLSFQKDQDFQSLYNSLHKYIIEDKNPQQEAVWRIIASKAESAGQVRQVLDLMDHNRERWRDRNDHNKYYSAETALELIRAVVRSGDPALALSIVESSHKHGLNPTEGHVKSALDLCTQAGDKEGVEMLQLVAMAYFKDLPRSILEAHEKLAT